MGDTVPEPALLAGRYELGAELGRGAMGTVYEAFDRDLQRPLALKTLRGAEPDDLYRLKSEFRALAGLNHPNLVRLYELVVEGDRGFFTMERVQDGLPITDYIDRKAARAPPEERLAAREAAVRGSFRQLALAIDVLHRAGKVHRDLKPSNVLVEPGGRVVLLDFGLVGQLENDLARRSQVGSLVGTIAYMAPEQAYGHRLTTAADWYSFGVLLYEALAERSPFADASPVELLDRGRFAPAPPDVVAPGCATDLSALALALLASDPQRRPDAAASLAILAVPGATSSAPPLAPVREPPFVGRRAEQAQLQRVSAVAQRGEVAVAVVQGPSGIGKTALLERFARQLDATGALVLRSRCYPHERVPFEALDEVVDELSRYLASLPVDELRELAPRHLAALRTLFPVLSRIAFPSLAAESGISGDAFEFRRRGFSALRDLLARLADRRRLVVWIDDLQWGDADSEPLLRELLRQPDAPPLLWMISYRSEDLGESPLLQSLDKLLEVLPPGRCERLTLRPLSRDECDELAAQLADASFEADALHVVSRASGGSPFLLTELLRAGPASTSAGSDPIASRVEARLATLPPIARRLLEVLTVAGAPVDRELARATLGLDAVDPDLVRRLEDEQLVRVGASRDASRLEVYHDQIRDVLDARLDTEERRRHHARLADALERLGNRDLGALFEHHRGAGAHVAAAHYGLRAGDQAADQLAFDQASRFYAAALDLDPDGCDRRQTFPKLGAAFANAGRGAEAAAAFEAAAEATADDAETAESLQRRAAEQYLVAGHLEGGIRVLRPLLEAHGLRFPDAGRPAIAATLGQLPALALHYTRFRPRSVPLDRATALRIEACQSAAKGLVVVDPALGACFAVRSLVEALRAGDVLLAGPSLCVVGASLVPLGGVMARWGRAMLRRAERMAATAGDPYLNGVLAISMAQDDFVGGRFQSMLDRCDRGSRILAERCRGTRWEINLAQMAALRALEELGEIAELRRRLAQALSEAVELDDRYAEVTFRLFAAFWEIARGEVTAARDGAHAAIERWGGRGFQMQHFYALRIQACCDLYEGNGEAALERLRAAWPAVREAGLLRHCMLASDALQLRARAALLAGERRAYVGPALAMALRTARALRRMQRADATAAAALIEASLALRDKRSDRARACLEEARDHYRSNGMRLHEAYATWRLAELLGGEAGRAHLAACAPAFASAEIREPARWLALHAPGFARTA